MHFWILLIAIISALQGGQMKVMAGLPDQSTKVFNNAIGSKHFLSQDGSIVLVKDSQGKLHRSINYGKDWVESPDAQLASKVVLQVKLHDHEKNRVFVSTADEVYYSGDGGASFQKLSVPAGPSGISGTQMWDFHPSQPDWLIYIGSGSKCPKCHNIAYYSTDNGRSWTELAQYAQKCIFAEDVNFHNVEREGVYCTRYDPQTGNQDDFRGAARTADGHSLQLVLFQQFNKNPKVLAGNVNDFYVFENFLGVAIQENDGIIFRSTTDGTELKKAVFPPHAFESGSPSTFTILKSPSKRIFLNALTSSGYNKEIGTLLMSDHTGTQFSYSLNDTNVNYQSFVDYERHSSIPGVILANQVTNANDVRNGATRKLTATYISANDGVSWNRVRMNDGQYLNLHSRTQLSPNGPIYTIFNATVMVGVGNVGDALAEYSQCQTYWSRDGGKSWRKIHDKPLVHEIIAYGSIIVAAPVEPTRTVYYLDKEDASVDSIGQWNQVTLNEEIMVNEIIGQDEGRGRKVSIYGNQSKFGMKEVVISLDFSNTGLNECRDDEMEEWKPSIIGQSSCFFGRDISFMRRKSQSQCFVYKDFKKPLFQYPACRCSEEDLECDLGFFRYGSECLPGSVAALKQPSGCLAGSKYQGPSGYQKIPSSECTNESELLKLKPVERVCGVAAVNPDVIDNTHLPKEFSTKPDSIVYFTNTTVLLIHSSMDSTIWKSIDSGKSWAKEDLKDIVTMIENPYGNRYLYAITAGNIAYKFDAKADSSNQWTLINLPAVPNSFGAPILEFNVDDPNLIIFTGNEDCDGFSSNCHTKSYFTQNGGQNWSSLVSYVVDCEWGIDAQFKEVSRNRIYCLSYREKSGNQRFKQPHEAALEMSDYFFQSNVVRIFDSVLGFAVSENFIVAAAFPNGQSDILALKVSVDGNNWANAVFPPGVDLSKSYTVLESKSGVVSVAVFHGDSHGKAWASLYTSNANGTFYSLSKEYVNRVMEGYVDFEHILGIDGVSVINVVSNPDKATLGQPKQFKTMITYNNGGSWWNLPNVPESGCSDESKCHLNIHGYTKRATIKNEMSDSGAIGMMIGIGNVGETLASYSDSNTYITLDAGMSWKKLFDGPYIFEFADHGNMLVFMHAEQPSKTVYYSYDFGKTMNQMTLNSPRNIIPEKFITEPDSTSLSLALMGKYEGSASYVSVFLDFAAKLPRQCVNSTLNDPEKSDFELITFVDREKDTCVFGHTTKYYRRKQDRVCYVGESYDNKVPILKENCQCKAEDFECSPGFYRSADNTCVPMPGFVGGWEECRPNGKQYMSHPYRKIGLSTCEGGVDLESDAQWKLCGSAAAANSAWSTVLFVFFPLGVLLYFGFRMYKREQLGPLLDSLGHLYERGKEKVSSWLPASLQRGPSYTRVNLNEHHLMDDY